MKVLFWCGILSVGVFAKPLTWDALVASAEDDPGLKASQQKLSALDGHSGTSLLDDLEFEYTLDGFGFMEHDFELKIKPKAFGEGAAAESYWKNQVAYQQAHQAIDRGAVLYERYENALRYVKHLQILALHQQLLQISNDRIEVLQALSGTETFRLQDLVTAMEDQATYSAKIVADSNALNDSRLKMLSWDKNFDSIDLDTSFLPTIEELKAILNSMPLDADGYSEVVTAKAKWKVSEAKAAQESAGDRNYISKIGVGYKYIYGKYKYKWVTTGVSGTSITEEWKLQRSDDDRRTRDKFYASVAIKLPFFSTDNSSNLKRQIDVLESERDYREARRNLLQKVERRREEILGLIAQREIQQGFVEQVDQGSLFEDFAVKAGNDPLLLLRAKESSLDGQLKIVQLDADIFTVYLELLEMTGSLARTDVTNHLKAGPAK